VRFHRTRIFNEGKTAYDVAVKLEYEECIEILESEGTDRSDEN
jgi:hypothetical protein